MNPRSRVLRSWGALAIFVFSVAAAAQRPAGPPPASEVVEILARTQQKSGDVFLLRGDVEIRYRGAVMRADEATYNEKTRTAEARGHVLFERDDDRIEAEEARYQFSTGEGVFHKVEGTVGVPPRGTTAYLVTTNPFYFEAERVERRRDASYLVERAWVTNCRPGRPKWRMRAARAQIRPGRDARLYRSSFVLGGMPVFYAPYAALSIAERPRQSGFLWPSLGNDSQRGTNFGGAYFWALNPHADVTFGAQWYNQGGWTQSVDFRALPTEKSEAQVNYFGALARKLNRAQARRGRRGVNQSGQFAHIFFTGELPHGFRGVVDLTHLSSLRFRLAFAETFNEAVRSEVHASAFVTNNPDTFYFNGYLNRYQNFLSSLQDAPETSVTLLAAPGFELGSRPRRLPWWKRPAYFSFDAHAGAMRRDEPRYKTANAVQRWEFAPSVSLPFHWGRLFFLTPTFGVRASRYGARVVDDPSQPGGKLVLNRPLRRITEEFSLNLRLPPLARIYERPKRRYKHVLEPEVTYRYVNGVRAFQEFLRFDERDLLTDTSEIEYGVTQRLFRREREGDAPAREFLSWRVAQKYYFDPDFRGALRPDTRNVFAALNSLTPFAFADGLRRFSPIVSSLRVTPGGRYDTDFRVDYDPLQHSFTSTRLTVTTKLTEEARFSVSHFVTRNRELLQPRSNQVRALLSYGQLNRRGFNAAVGFTYDARRDFLPNTVAQVSYNWDCCGVAFSYRRLGLGPLRAQNEFRFAFTIANVGTAGTIRQQERLF
jgi:LPS-assembly protein